MNYHRLNTLFAIVTFAVILDCATTIIGISIGFQEGNPFFGTIGALALLLTNFPILFGLEFLRCREKIKMSERILIIAQILFVCNCFFGFVNNTLVILHLYDGFWYNYWYHQ